MYKLIIPKESLKKAVSFTKKSLPPLQLCKDESIEHLLFNIENQTLTIKSTNFNFKALCSIEISNESDTNFSFTLNSKILEKLLTKIDVPDIELLYNSTENSIKIYTTENKKSYVTLKSFPIDSIQTFEKPEENLIINKHIINRNTLLSFLEVIQNFLPDENILASFFNEIVIKKDYMLASNGKSKICFILSDVFKNITKYSIEKTALPLYLDILKTSKDDEVVLIETEEEYGIESKSKDMFFSYTKPNSEEIKIPEKYLKATSTCIIVNKDKLSKALDRLSTLSIMNVPTFRITVKENDLLEIQIIGGHNSCISKDSIEYVECSKSDDKINNIENVIDYKTIRSIINSVDMDNVKLFFFPDEKFFTMHSANTSFTIIGVGAYSIVKNT